MRARRRSFLTGVALLCLALPASVAAWPGATPAATWVAPTPAEGHRFTATVGRELAFSVAALAPGGPIVNVAIGAEGLPGNAALKTALGNPATARVTWTPTSSHAGQTFNVRLTAQPGALGISPALRNLTLAVQPLSSPPPRPKPRPRPKRKSKTFVLSSTKHELYRYAFVIRPAVVRAAPRRTSAAVASLARWTPEGTTNLILALEGRRTSRGVWIKVRLPILPANRTGWVKRKTLSDWKELRTRLIVDRRRLTATLYRRGKAIFRAPVGIGVSRWPTPRGEFFIRNQLYGFGNPVYGPIAFGTSARSPVLTDWPGGGFIGIHGTNQPHILPGRVSHGCIRMKNGHILRLARLMPVGSPLTVL